MRLLRHNPLIKPTLKSVLLDKPLRELFKKRYKDNYNFIYQAEDEIEEKENSLIFIPQLVKNILCTDREIAAFMYTIKEFNVMDW